MSLLTKAIGLAKKVKHRTQDRIRANTPVYLSPVRRIERVALRERVIAMTFDDGPCALPARPSAEDKPLTQALLDTLERYGARGTFDVVGDTGSNYPDRPGKTGTASWGGVRYDHYPDFDKDAFGGVKHCDALTRRILAGGHEITSHTWSHRLFGPKPLVYGSRVPLQNVDEVIADLATMDDYMKEHYDYRIRLSRPPHYVDKTRDGFSAYDAYAALGYQYLAASFDGAGWLPLSSYEAEVEAMQKPLEKALSEDPDALCGQIIFHKDGYNMARRSPVADGLGAQLKLLTERGYRVVTVSELLERCPFADLAPDDPLFEAAKTLLERGYCVCYSDNTVRADAPLTRGELAMFLYGGRTDRIAFVRAGKAPARDMKVTHPYAAAVAAALEAGELSLQNGKAAPGAVLTAEQLRTALSVHFQRTLESFDAPVTHRTLIEMIKEKII